MSTAPTGYQAPKTNWQSGNIPLPADLNRIEGNAAAIETGNRTIDQTQVPSSNAGTLRQFLDWLANRIKAITGKVNWYDAPATTLEAAKGHIDASNNPHEVTAAQVGAETPAGAQAKVDAHAGNTNNPHNVTAAQIGAETPAGAQAKVDTHAAASGAHPAAKISVADTGEHFTATDVEGTLAELFTFVSSGKTTVASAITDMGQAASGGDSFDTLAGKIRDISNDADAAVANVDEGKTFYQGGVKRTGTKPAEGFFEASDDVLASNGGYKQSYSDEYIEAYAVNNRPAGVLRYKCSFYRTAGTGTVYVAIYKNGKVVSGTIQSTTSTSPQSYSKDVAAEKSDEIVFRYRSSNTSTRVRLSEPSVCGKVSLATAPVPDIVSV